MGVPVTGASRGQFFTFMRPLWAVILPAVVGVPLDTPLPPLKTPLRNVKRNTQFRVLFRIVPVGWNACVRSLQGFTGLCSVLFRSRGTSSKICVPLSLPPMGGKKRNTTELSTLFRLQS